MYILYSMQQPEFFFIFSTKDNFSLHEQDFTVDGGQSSATTVSNDQQRIYRCARKELKYGAEMLNRKLKIDALKNTPPPKKLINPYNSTA